MPFAPFGPGAPGRPFVPDRHGDRFIVTPSDVSTITFVYATWPGRGPNPLARLTPDKHGERIIPSDIGRQTIYVFPGLGPRRPGMFTAFAGSKYQYSITGVTRDSAGVALGSCVVELYRTDDTGLAGKVTSDGAGNYAFLGVGPGPFFAVAYKAGSPDIAGTTVNTLRGA